MNPENTPASGQPAEYNQKSKIPNTLSVMQAGEMNICTVKRHPIGILINYIMSGLIVVIVAIITFAVAPSGQTDGDQIRQIGSVLLLVLAVVLILYCLIATKVYWGNSWVLTSDSLTQVNQTSLFNRQSSQLSLGNLEDISAEQNGILTHIFNYGLLKVETAGEHSKFQFAFCPNPNYYAQQIIAAREAFEQKLERDHGVNVNNG